MAEQKGETARWAQVASTIFLGLVGLVFTGVLSVQQEKNRNAQVELQEKNRQAQLGLQLMSQREQSETDFRQKMFVVLVEKLLNPDVDVRERITRLQLFQHNFHDIFNGRALFDDLEREAEKKPTKERDALIDDLVSLAKEITEAQELLVGADLRFIPMTEGDNFTVALKSEKDNHEQGEEHEHSQEGVHEINIKLIKVRAHAVEVELTIEPGNPESRKRKFEVSYFDAPLTDNILLPDRHRFAITLKETNMKARPRKATLNMFEFPAGYVTTGYRPSISEANKMLRGTQ